MAAPTNEEVLSYIFKVKVEKGNFSQEFREMKAGFVDLAATAEKGSNAATTLTKKINELNKANSIEKLGKDFGTMAVKINDADQAAKLLAGRLAEIGASKGEIEAAGVAFINAQNASTGNGGAGGGLGINGLRRTGSALSQLGLEPLGSGVSTLGGLGQVVKEFQLLSQVIPGVSTATTALTPALGATAAGFAATTAVLLPIVAVVLAVGLAVKALSDEFDRSAKAHQAELDYLKQENDLKNANIEAARTRSAEANRQQAQDDEQKFKNQQDLLNKLRADRAEIDRQYAETGDPLRRHDLATKGADTDKAIEDASKVLNDLGLSIQNTVLTLGPEIDQREAEQRAIKAEEDALKAKEKAIADAGKVELEARTLAKTATEAQVRSLLDNIATQRSVLAEQAKQMEDLGQSSKEYTDQIVVLDARTKALTDTTLKAAIANDKAKDAAKSLEEAGKAAIKYADDVKNINDKYYQDQADAAQKLADKQTEIQDQAVQAAEQLLENLQVKYADLSKNLGRSLDDQQTKYEQDQLQKQIDFQRAEVAAEKKYQADIARIKEQAQEAEFEQGLDRDFAGLARTKRQTAQQISDVTRQAQADREARLQAYRDQQDDAQRAFANERALKILQYQRSLEDAQEAYARDQKQLVINRNRALAAAQQAEQKELQILNDKHQKELTAKYEAAKKEISLAQQASDVRIQIMQREYATALALFNALGQGSSGGSTQNIPMPFANGGALGAGRLALVNESGSSGRESFSSGGKTAKFPGMGLFIPSRGGQVNSNRGDGSVMVSNTFNISGSDPNAVMKVIDDKLETSIRRIFRQKASA